MVCSHAEGRLGCFPRLFRKSSAPFFNLESTIATDGGDSHNPYMQTAAPITSADLGDMVGHWLSCPPNGYLGQSYGSDVKQVLHTPMAAGLVNDMIEKCRADVPLASRLGPGGINVYAYDAAMDKKVVVFEVAGELVPVPGDNT